MAIKLKITGYKHVIDGNSKTLEVISADNVIKTIVTGTHCWEKLILLQCCEYPYALQSCDLSHAIDGADRILLESRYMAVITVGELFTIAEVIKSIIQVSGLQDDEIQILIKCRIDEGEQHESNTP